MKKILGKMKLFGAIAKMIDQDDGTIIVEGFASSGAKDAAGEIVTPDAMKAALPEYMAFGNIREMHKASAAGVALEAEVQEDGQTFVRAHVVDPTAVLKCRTGVYKGFSIGGNVTDRDPEDRKVIKGLTLVEISLVDRPCNPDAVFAMYKAEGIDGENENDGSTGDGEQVESGEGGDEAPKEKPAGEGAEGDGESGDDEGAKPKEGEESGDAAAGDEESDEGDDDKADKSATVAGADTIEKGAYSISRIAEIASSLEWLAQDCEWEGRSGAVTLVRKAALFLLDALLSLVDDDVAAAKERIKAAQDMAATMAAAAKSAGAGAGSEELRKLLSDSLAKVGPPIDVVAIAKAAGLDDVDDIAKAFGELAGLRKAKATWEAAPAPAKGTLTAVSKAGDSSLAKVTAPEGADDEPQTALGAIKKAIAAPIRLT